MKLLPYIQPADAKKMRRRGELAFTMVEIAIAIGVIGFALVAIIGILPRGMNVQKDTRGYTIIGQDSAYFLDAIRNGAVVTNLPYSARGLDFLTNYVQYIRFDYLVNGVTNATSNYNNFTNGAEIIGLLSTPQTNFFSPFFSNNFFYVSAICRALSGPATEQNPVNNVMAFNYRMEVMVTPFNSFAPDTTNWNNPPYPLDVNQYNICYNRWLAATPGAVGTATTPISTAEGIIWVSATNAVPAILATNAITGALSYNLFNVCLRFSWPYSTNGTTINAGNGRQSYSTVVGAQLMGPETINGEAIYWFFQPQNFTNQMTPGL
jgi:type II secretory pathway pseudopilin PulG